MKGPAGPVRVAAFGDVHVGEDSPGRLRPHLEDVDRRADLLLIAGDITRCGTPAEAAILCEELADVELPVVAVLGNHDCHAGEAGAVADVLQSAGVRVLDGEGERYDIGGTTVGVAGVKGFGGGFPGASASAFGEAEMKAFVGHSRTSADRLQEALEGLGTDVSVALTHYAPVPDTLLGERLEIYPFLGSSFLAEAIDACDVDLAVHGHAHQGTEHGVTPRGVPVRNVAQPVIHSAYQIYRLQRDCTDEGSH